MVSIQIIVRVKSLTGVTFGLLRLVSVGTSGIFLTLDPCLSMAFTVSCIVCGVMFISSIGIESLLGGGVGLTLVLGNAGSGSAKMFVVPGPINEENLASRFRNLLDTKSLILEISPCLSLKILTTGLNLFILEHTL